MCLNLPVAESSFRTLPLTVLYGLLSAIISSCSVCLLHVSSALEFWYGFMSSKLFTLTTEVDVEFDNWAFVSKNGTPLQGAYAGKQCYALGEFMQHKVSCTCLK